MISLDRLDPKELTALQFADDESFTKAAEVLIHANVQLEPVGNHTLVIRSDDVRWLEKNDISFKRFAVLDAARNGNGIGSSQH
jgi:hypothetical protein